MGRAEKSKLKTRALSQNRKGMRDPNSSSHFKGVPPAEVKLAAALG
jgi:hypothetical protein